MKKFKNVLNIVGGIIFVVVFIALCVLWPYAMYKMSQNQLLIFQELSQTGLKGVVDDVWYGTKGKR